MAAVSLITARSGNGRGADVAVSLAGALVFGVWTIRAARSGVLVETDRVVIRNILRTHAIPVPSVDMFTVGPAPLWFFASARVAIVKKVEGARVVISAIEPRRDGERLLNDLNADLEAARQAGRGAL